MFFSMIENMVKNQQRLDGFIMLKIKVKHLLCLVVL